MKTITLKCAECGKTFVKKLKWFNYLTKRKNQKNFYCSKNCFKSHASNITIEKNCRWCNKIFKTVNKSKIKKCCSEKCAAHLSRSFVDSKNISKSMIEYHRIHKKKKIPKEIVCKCCGKIFLSFVKRKTCGDECNRKLVSLGGRKSVAVQKNNRRSKNEILFSELCKIKFKNVLTNEPIFNGWDADVIIQDLNIAILWNGKWHYEKITKEHSLEQVRNRDNIKISEIKKCGYIPYIIKDMGKENSEFVHQEFDKFLEFIGSIT